MNKKLIAAAVSAVVIAPVAQAQDGHADIEVYGRINNAIDLNGLAADGESTTDITSVASRFGLRGTADLGNGLTAHGHYEFATTTDRESSSGSSTTRTAVDSNRDTVEYTDGTATTGVDDIRIATVGISGAFGRVDIGNQWSAYFNTVGTLISPTYTLGAHLYSGNNTGGLYRSSNTIKYSNSFGPVNLELDARLNGSNESADVAEGIRGDGFGIGLSFAITDNITLAGSYDTESGADRGERAYIQGTPQIGFDAIEAIDARGALVEAADARDATAADVRGEIAFAVGYDVFDSQGNFVRVVDRVEALRAINVGDRIITVDHVTDANGVSTTVDAVTKLFADSTPEERAAVVNAVDAVAASPNYQVAGDEVVFAAADEFPDSDSFGLALNGTFGNFHATVGFQSHNVDEDNRSGAEVDVDSQYLYVGGNIGEKTSWLVGYSQADNGRDARAAVAATTREITTQAQANDINNGNAANVVTPQNPNPRNVRVGDHVETQAARPAVPKTDDSTQLTWGVYHNVGGGLRLYYEATSLDSGTNDGERHLLGMRFDF